MKKFIFLFLFFSVFFLTPFSLFSQENPEYQDDLTKKIQEYTQKIISLGQAKKTLQNEIIFLNSQINLTLLQIQQTEATISTLKQEITQLSIKIDQLDVSLNQLSTVFIHQVAQNYKTKKQVPPFFNLIFGNLSKFIQQQKYLAQAQKNSRDTLLSMETIRTNYDIQKQKKEQKQQELEALQVKLDSQKVQLASQKQDKDHLLSVTQNDETKYQELLSQAQEELAAIEAIVAGRADETMVGKVSTGDKIATLIYGKSCNSSGTHLHFMVKNNGKTENPFSFLSSISYINNTCYPSPCQQDLFNPSGNLPWPLKETIKFNQGYGNSWAVNHMSWLPYKFHSGIDIASTTSNDVYATHEGILYQGSYKGSCTLKYVKISNQETGIDTLYLHVNYH